MTLKALFEQVRDAVIQAGDPDRDLRIDEYAQELERGVRRNLARFDVQQALAALPARKMEHAWIVSRVYERALIRVWRDERITSRQRAALDAVASALHLSPSRKRELERTKGLQVFGAALARTLEDGILTEDEHSALERVAAGLDSSTAAITAEFFEDQADSFLRNALLHLDPSDARFAARWGDLENAARRLGLTRTRFEAAVIPQLTRMIEHSLADAKEDERLDADEQTRLERMLTVLPLPDDVRAYVRSEMLSLEQLTAASDGVLPSITSHEAELRSGELCHLEGNGTFGHTRVLKSGPQTDHFDGIITITDARLIFTSPARSFSLPHQRVLKIERGHGGVYVNTSGHRKGLYAFAREPHLAAMIYRTAVRRANQTVVSAQPGASRHIPRDVRQRVWQQYGGRCVDCGADQYLEFDHIIPVAKGGSNSIENVQLLCRRCNLAKSDYI